MRQVHTFMHVHVYFIVCLDIIFRHFLDFFMLQDSMYGLHVHVKGDLFIRVSMCARSLACVYVYV
jgi:hypothetical protein